MSEFRETRLSKAKSLLNRGLNPYAETFDISHNSKFLIDKYDYLENGQEVDLNISIAGRVLARRIMGKIAFFSISDQEGDIQLYLEKQIIDKNADHSLKHLSFNDLKELVDIGDWIGVKGTLKKTNKGELSIKNLLLWVISKDSA